MSAARSRLAHWWRWWTRDLLGYRPRHSHAEHPADVEPGGGVGVTRDGSPAAFVVAVLLPMMVGLALLPWRDDLTTATVAVILVLPVVLAAILGGMAPGAVAALSAVATFDVGFTVPYGRVVIDSAEDLEVAFVLLVIGLAVGQLTGRQAQLRRAAEVRTVELHALTHVIDMAATRATSTDLVAAVGAGLAEILDLREWEWTSGPKSGAFPVVRRDGGIAPALARAGASDPSVPLPIEGAEIPVMARGHQVGRFVVHPRRGSRASIEQRRVAGALAAVLGAALADRDQPLDVEMPSEREAPVNPSTRRSV